MKQEFDTVTLTAGYVAPRAGAWIETMPHYQGAQYAASPPVRGRGLKQQTKAPGVGTFGRPPCGGVD